MTTIHSKFTKIAGIALTTALSLSVVLNGSNNTDTIQTVNTETMTTTIAPVSVKTQSMKFATYNVCAQNCPKMASFKSRAKGIAKQIKALKPDVVVMQETGTSGNHMKSLRRSMSPQYKSTVGAKSRYIFYRTATMTERTVKGKRTERGTFMVQANRNSKKTYIAYQILRRIRTNASVIVVDNHLTSLDSRGSDMARQGEIKKVIVRTKALRNRHKGIPAIFAGDFNSYRQGNVAGVDSDTNRFRVYNYMKTVGFEDAVVKASSTVNAKMNTLNPEPGDTRNFGEGRHLDHFFVPSNVSVSKWGMVNRKVSYRNQFSDHDMSYAVFAILAR